MYISGGSNVYPREIEEVLLTHPAMPKSASSACRTGVGRNRCGRVGFERRRDGDPTELLAHLEGQLAKYKCPTCFVFWPELPKSGYGKVVKREVKRLLEATA